MYSWGGLFSVELTDFSKTWVTFRSNFLSNENLGFEPCTVLWFNQYITRGYYIKQRWKIYNIRFTIKGIKKTRTCRSRTKSLWEEKWLDSVSNTVVAFVLFPFSVYRFYFNVFLLRKIFDPLLTPHKLTPETTLGFIKKALESAVPRHQVEALSWLQVNKF